MDTDRDAARRLDYNIEFLFPGDFAPGGRRPRTVKASL